MELKNNINKLRNSVDTETQFKADLPEDLLKYGVYFKSENDVTTQYLIEICEGKFEGNAIVMIYTTEILSNYFKTEGLMTGNVIGIPKFEVEKIVEIDLSGKYFFLRFKEDIQLYYDNKKYYDTNSYKSDSVASLFEVINFAIEYTINKSGITPY